MLSLQFPILPSTSTIKINKPFSFPNDLSESFNQKSYVSKFRLAAGRGSKRAAFDTEVGKMKSNCRKGLDPEMMPKHVALIMDGHRRWAKNRGLSVQLGHRALGKSMKQLALNCKKFGVQVVTVFAFSTENWRRPKKEVDFLMSLYEEIIQSDFDELIKNDVCLTFIGNRSQLPKSLQNCISSAEGLARDNRGMRLVVAINYSGRQDITEAARRIASKVKGGLLQVGDIDESLFEQHLETSGIDEFPNPNVLVRTSGELRISNFMLWQLAYTEMVFVDKLFPDFDEDDLVRALRAFQRRERRFGGYA